MWGLIPAASCSHTAWLGYSLVEEATAERKTQTQVWTCSPGTRDKADRFIRLLPTHRKPITTPEDSSLFLASFAEDRTAAVPETEGR